MVVGWYVHFPSPSRLLCSYAPSALPGGVPRKDKANANVFVGAMLEEPIKEGDTGPPKMKGSACLIGAKTREEVVERLKQDVYVKEGVWNLEDMQIIPFKSAVRKAL